MITCEPKEGECRQLFPEIEKANRGEGAMQTAKKTLLHATEEYGKSWFYCWGFVIPSFESIPLPSPLLEPLDP